MGKAKKKHEVATEVLAALNHERLPVVVARRRADAARIARGDELSGLLHDARHVVLKPP